MKKIAIIGAGFAGLAAAYFLSTYASITIFEQKKIGAGASGVSAGLLHPYPGKHHRRSWYADEALSEAIQLLDISEKFLNKPVTQRKGILKIGDFPLQADDVEVLDSSTFLIKSGLTVFPEFYLEGLWKACQSKGVVLEIQKIFSLEDLHTFDQIIIAAGSGIAQFLELQSFKLQLIKGQTLHCKLSTPLERSIITNTYEAVSQDPHICYIGATYEKIFTHTDPCLKTAVEYLKPKSQILDCRAGVRVRNTAHYFPIINKINPKTWAITALGSRGLLYHAYLGKKLTQTLYPIL